MTVVRNTPGAGALPPPPNQLMKYVRTAKQNFELLEFAARVGVGGVDGGI